MSVKEKIHKGSGNVFADIGVPHPERVLARSQIMARITEIIKERGLTQKEAALLLNLPQSKVSCLMNGKLSMFSLDHLFKIWLAVGCSIIRVLLSFWRRFIYQVEKDWGMIIKNGKCVKCGNTGVYLMPGKINVSYISISIFNNVYDSNYICSKCGYIESYIDEPKKLEDLIQKSKKI